MPEAGQQVDVRGPWTDTMQGGKSGVRLVRRYVRELCKIDLAFLDRAGDGFERADFRTRQAKPRQPRRPCAKDRRRLERIECRGQPSPDRAGTRDRQLL
jgi:hypothetical protein